MFENRKLVARGYVLVPYYEHLMEEGSGSAWRNIIVPLPPQAV